jgi:hypothetical protein
MTVMKETALQVLRAKLKRGRVYRREDLARWSNSVDRHLATLLELGVLKKLRQGLYSYPKQSVFGEVPPEDKELVRAFLKTNDFLLVSPNLYNSMGLGATQLYNSTLVYNHKRHGRFQLNNRWFEFRLVHYPLPNKLTEDFLLVELMNHPEMLAEERSIVEKKVAEKVRIWEPARLRKAVRSYSLETGKKAFQYLMSSHGTATS